MECTEQCGRERFPSESMTAAIMFNNQLPALTYGYPVVSNSMTNNTYAPSRISGSIYGYDDFVNRGRNIFGVSPANSRRRSRIGLLNSNDSPEVLMNDVLFLLVPLSIINALAIFWTRSRIERYTLPLSHQKFTEGNFRIKEQLLCLCAGAMLVLFNTVIWGSMLCFGPGFFWKFQMEGTCRGFDTNIRIHDPGADYFGLQNKTLGKGQAFAPLYTQTRSRYDYPSPEDYESYQFGIDLFNITKINSTDPSSATRKPFEEHWRIMGIYGGKPLYMDFDLLNHAWRINEGSINIDGNNSSSYFHGGQFSKSSIPNFATAIQNLTLVRNGTWTPTNENNRHTVFPELKLHIPHWYLFDKNCVYQSFMRVFKEGVGEEEFSRKEIGEQRGTKWKNWKKDSRREEVLRTASYGYGGHLGLEVCARRNEYMWSRNGKMGREEGMGDDLLVPLGLMAVVRKSMREERGMLEYGCKWTVYG
ncbi:hypothetical protein EYC80_001746 [Monilinia laxa]|uniref:Uncharacterized protein n=1 Tax=Monilinia laxa TaxID=61186 RepID=A0A5N6K5W9_MONLA|nr:hypothetical protein EYC80_001746 [Monilinia laxa]